MVLGDSGILAGQHSKQLSEPEQRSTRDSDTNERFETALEQLQTWYDEWRPKPDREAGRYVVCVGLAVMHRMREGWPMARAQYISGLDVRTSGPLIRNILAQYGIHRMYASAGGRTSGPAIFAAEALANRMNAIAADWNLETGEREEIIDGLQAWLVEKVERYFAEHPIPENPTKLVHKSPRVSER